MRKAVLYLLFLICAAASLTAEEAKLLERVREYGPFGIGGVIGEPTGITAKIYAAENIAFDATVSWSFVSHDTFYFHADYLHHTDSFFGLTAEGLKFYAGFGGMVQLSGDPEFGPRIPFGLSYSIPNVPVEAFFEAAPIMLLYPETRAAGSIGIGARFFFGSGEQSRSGRGAEARADSNERNKSEAEKAADAAADSLK